MKSLPGMECAFPPTPQKCPSHKLGDCLGRECPLKASLSLLPQLRYPSFLVPPLPVFRQPPRQDERAVAESTHFGDTFPMVCGLLAILWAEAAFPCTPEEGHHVCPGSCSLPTTLAVLGLGSFHRKAGVPLSYLPVPSA